MYFPVNFGGRGWRKKIKKKGSKAIGSFSQGRLRENLKNISPQQKSLAPIGCLWEFKN